MRDYGMVRSAVCPENKVVDDYGVWINTEITEDGGEYVYYQVRYDKDEYIKMIGDQNDELNIVVNTILGVE